MFLFLLRMLSHLVLFFMAVLFGYLLGLMFFFKEVRASLPATPAEYMAILFETRVQGFKYKIDPDLILAVIEVESNFNPRVTGKHGEVGLMQLMPKHFPTAQFDIQNNIQSGTAHLAYVRERCPSQLELTWLICFNQGILRTPKYPRRHKYYVKVMRAYEKIKSGQNFTFNK